MSSLRRNRILSSTSFRLTMVYAAIFVGVTLATIFSVGSIVMLILEGDLKDEVSTELRELQELDETESRPALIEEIERRSRSADRPGRLYQLNSATGVRLAGEVDFADAGPGWFEFIPPGEEDDEYHLARSVALGDGASLVVAADKEAILDTWELMLTGTGWTLGISFPLALLCGALMSAMVLRRIEAISTTTQRIRDGGLSQRAPLRGTGDEFDRLTTHINEMLDSIEALTKSIHEVSTGVAHDLRTPLTRVSNRLQELRGREIAGDSLEREIAVIQSELGSVLTTFDALLRIGEIDAGTRRAGFRRLDLSGLVSDLAETYEVMAEENRKSLTTRIAPGIEFFGDRSLLVQMVANVLDNAIVHTPAGTRICLFLSPGPGRADLVIFDDGPGVSDSERERVVRRFYRANGSRRGSGNGLGMSIVNSISNLHGIKLSISDNAPGLRVAFEIPTVGTAADAQPDQPHVLVQRGAGT